MNVSRAAALLLTLCALAAPTNASAQGHEERCNALVAKLCGASPAEQCFVKESLWSEVPDDCIGDVQTMIEMAREASEEGAESGGIHSSNVRDLEGDLYGASYSGVLRSGPGMEHGKVASLVEGEQIRILENTGVVFNEYNWYRVLTVHGEGFHWGGIFCSESGDYREGILSRCQDGLPGSMPPPAATIVLQHNGIKLDPGEDVPFGTAVSRTLERLTYAFGVGPSSRNPLEDCDVGADEAASWDNGFTAYLAGDRFVGWTSVDQRTAEGIGFGSSRADVTAAYRPAFAEGVFGTEFLVDGYIGLMESAAADAAVADFRAGLTCVMH